MNDFDKMSDKERVLFHIVSRFYPRYILGLDNRNHELFDKCKDSNLKVDDLVLCLSSGIHNYTVGYITRIIDISNMDIREIGSDKVCNISNEMFYKIDTDNLSKFYLLEGLKFKTFRKVEKAIANIDIGAYRFNDINFEDNQCIVELRRKFSDKSVGSFSFNYNKNTTIKEIAQLIKTFTETLNQ